jgi:hypothetical protein
MSTAAADIQFFRGEGAKGICAAMTRELTVTGEIGKRGDDTIDKFIVAVNARLTTPQLSEEALQTLKGMAEFCINRGDCMGMDEGLNDDNTPQPFRAELEKFASSSTAKRT